MTFFFEIAVVLAIAAASAFVLYFFKQPTMVGYIFAGVFLGYLGYAREDQTELIESLSSIGVALLLFIVGLEIKLNDVREVGLPSILTGIGQVAISFTAAFWLSTSLGYSNLVSFYIACALSFASTAIIIKLLSDQKDLKSLYGRLALGFLLIQDMIVILILILLSGFIGGGTSPANFIFTLLKGGGFIALTLIVSRYLPKFLDFVGRAPDLLYIFSLAWAVGIAAFFASDFVGLTVEIGGFLAGISLANSSEHFQIAARLKPLRDFFIIIFFIGLGAKVLVGGESLPIMPIMLFSLFVIVFNPLIVMTILSALGYRSRTSFLASLVTAQVSEFSFIVMFLGAKAGQVSSPIVSLIAVVGLITIFLSSYLIIYGKQIYAPLQKFLKIFEFRKNLIEETGDNTELQDHIVLAGAHRMGQNILRALSNNTVDFVAVDFDPIRVKHLRRIHLPVFYGDITDPDIQELVSLSQAKVFISTVPDYRDNLSVLEFLKNKRATTKTIITAQDEHEAESLYSAGADYVLLPHYVGGLEIARLIENDAALNNLHSIKERDFKMIKSI